MNKILWGFQFWLNIDWISCTVTWQPSCNMRHTVAQFVEALCYLQEHLMDSQHLALWRGPSGIQRQARELISGPDLATGAMDCVNRTQSRAVIGLLTGHNTLRRHLHVMELSNNPTCRKCGTEEETSVHILTSVRP